MSIAVFICIVSITEFGHVKSKFKRTGDLTMDIFTKQTPAPRHEKHTATVFGTQIAPLPLFDIQRLVQ
jgi:hypothetical protein